MRRSSGFQQQCYGNGNGNSNGYGHGYDGMWVKSQDQMQHYDTHEESWQSHSSGMNMSHGRGGYAGSEFSDVHHATFGGKGNHGQLQQGWHGGNDNKKWHNPAVNHHQQKQKQKQHHHQQGHGGNFNSHFNFNSNSNANANGSVHFEYVSEDEFEFESYSSEEHCYPGTTSRVNEMRFEHQNMGKNMNWNPNAGRKTEWLIKGV